MRFETLHPVLPALDLRTLVPLLQPQDCFGQPLLTTPHVSRAETDALTKRRRWPLTISSSPSWFLYGFLVLFVFQMYMFQMCMYIYDRIHLYNSPHVCMYMYTFIYTCIVMHTHICIYSCVCREIQDGPAAKVCSTGTFWSPSFLTLLARSLFGIGTRRKTLTSSPGSLQAIWAGPSSDPKPKKEGGPGKRSFYVPVSTFGDYCAMFRSDERFQLPSTLVAVVPYQGQA